VEFAETFAAWDSAWYLDIAQRGYVFRDDAQSSVAFFPLYPLLIRAAASLFGGSERALWMSAIVLSYASFFAALVLLHRLTDRLLHDRDAARRAVLYAAVFPFSSSSRRSMPSRCFSFSPSQQSGVRVPGAGH
jgi:Gpi18-like mannosyltransferase